MQLNSAQFREQLQNGTLRLTLVGMSNIGKTYWSRKLRRSDFWHICCDDLIEAKLEPDLKELGYSGIADVSKWLGQPYDERFIQNQEKYLAHEIATMKEIIENPDKSQNYVIDTTGSVIYTGEQICQQLKDNSFVVYIKETPEMLDRMLSNYLKNPKPVLWGDSYRETGSPDQKSQERNYQSIKESYPKLLEYRSGKYDDLADLVLNYHDLNKDFSSQDFLDHLISKL